MAVLSVLSEYRTANLLHVAAAAALLYALYYLGVIIYRLYFHPLAKIPGARLGTVTWLREAYYQVWCAGRFPMQYLEDHKKYGPYLLIPSPSHPLNSELHRSNHPSQPQRSAHLGPRILPENLPHGLQIRPPEILLRHLPPRLNGLRALPQTAPVPPISVRAVFLT